MVQYFNTQFHFLPSSSLNLNPRPSEIFKMSEINDIRLPLRTPSWPGPPYAGDDDNHTLTSGDK